MVYSNYRSHFSSLQPPPAMFVTAIPYLILLVISIAPRGSAFSDPLGIVYAPAMVKRQVCIVNMSNQGRLVGSG